MVQGGSDAPAAKVDKAGGGGKGERGFGEQKIGVEGEKWVDQREIVKQKSRKSSTPPEHRGQHSITSHSAPIGTLVDTRTQC